MAPAACEAGYLELGFMNGKLGYDGRRTPNITSSRPPS